MLARGRRWTTYLRIVSAYNYPPSCVVLLMYMCVEVGRSELQLQQAVRVMTCDTSMIVTGFSRGSLILADIIVIVVTWMATRKMTRLSPDGVFETSFLSTLLFKYGECIQPIPPACTLTRSRWRRRYRNGVFRVSKGEALTL